jgi:hypothetical protein
MDLSRVYDSTGVKTMGSIPHFLMKRRVFEEFLAERII